MQPPLARPQVRLPTRGDSDEGRVRVQERSCGGHRQARGVTDALKIEDGNERVDGDYLIFTYTDGKGIVPTVVERFLEQNPGVKGVVGSGSRERHADTFNFAADKIAEKYGVPVIAKLDLDGTEEDLEVIKKAL